MVPKRWLFEQIKRTASRVDWSLVVAACCLVAIGVTFIWSVSTKPADAGWLPLAGLARRQALWAVVALAAMAGSLLTPYRFLARFGYTLYVLVLGALIYLLISVVPGPENNFARRWITLGPVNVQPSEFAKVIFVIALAKYLRYKESYRTWWGLLLPFAMALVPMVLVAAEPDLGSAVVFLPVVFGLLYIAGARIRHLVLYLLAALLLLGLLWLLGLPFLADYQRNRLLAFLNPEEYARGPGLQLIRSLIAVGSGGLWGKGLGQGIQGQLGFLPASRTDFIFACIAEEAGFVGAMVVLGLYLFLFLGGVAVARRTRDPFGRLLAVGVIILVATQALINTGMTIQLAPVTGLPLPFVSYGGSSLVSNFIALGLLLNVGARPGAGLSREDFQ